MKGILLAGGHGTRLAPSTDVTNKHLLNVYDRPMIFYPIGTLIESGITEILVVTGKEHMGDMIELLGSGKDFNASFTYRVQDEAGGIAEALMLAEEFATDDDIAVILGDNFFEDSFNEDIAMFGGGAKVFLKEVPDPKRFGVAQLDPQGNNIIGIIEKPKYPRSNLAVTGFYIYNFEVFDFIRAQEYSKDELQITDTNFKYLEEQELEHRIVEGYWSDMGTPESLHRTAGFVASQVEPKGMK